MARIILLTPRIYYVCGKVLPELRTQVRKELRTRTGWVRILLRTGKDLQTVFLYLVLEGAADIEEIR